MALLKSDRRRAIRTAIAGLLASILLFSASNGWGQFGGGMGGGGRHGPKSDDKSSDASDLHDTYKPKPPPVTLMPHAGEYLSTERNYYEVVYMPLQTRIYLYDSKFKPVSAQDVQAQMTIQFPTEKTPRQVSFQFVPMPTGATEQDYVVASIDVQPLQDKDVNVTIQFSGLTHCNSSTASFTPHFANFKAREYVVQASLVESDRDGIMRQRVCPVSGVPLGSRGQAVKLYVAEFPIYVASPDCIAAVKAAPQKFMPTVGPAPR